MKTPSNNPSTDKLSNLLGNIGRLHARYADRIIARIGLFRGQAILLLTLSEQDGMTHSEIAELLEISAAATTKVIKRLETRKFLQRRSDPADERISRVFLLEEGWAKIEQITRCFDQLDQFLLADFSIEDRATLIDLLSRMYTHLHAALENPPE